MNIKQFARAPGMPVKPALRVRPVAVKWAEGLPGESPGPPLVASCRLFLKGGARHSEGIGLALAVVVPSFTPALTFQGGRRGIFTRLCSFPS